MANDGDKSKNSRRLFMQKAGALAIAASPLRLLAATDTSEGITFADGPRPLVKYPGKRELIRVHTRPPHLETPFSVFNESVITPNDAFFVRYHLADFPTSVDLNTFRLTVKGAITTPLSLSMAELKAITEQINVVAVNQCSGNSRGYSSPRVFGAQLGNGAMGNAKWGGIPLKAVLEKAGVSTDAKYVAFNGLDRPAFLSTPDFQKALDIDHAMNGEPMIAWEMNDEDLPQLNGFPLKLIIPGYFGTYWVKHLSEITVLDEPFEGHDAYFMTTGYRLPDNECMCVAPGSTAAKTLPISTLPVRSFITNIKADDILPLNSPIELRGIAFDSGIGISKVDVSTDGGKSWQAAKLSDSLGRYSFREWKLTVSFAKTGANVLMVKATNKKGETQPFEATWNHGGYRRNIVESTPITIS